MFNEIRYSVLKTLILKNNFQSIRRERFRTLTVKSWTDFGEEEVAAAISKF